MPSRYVLCKPAWQADDEDDDWLEQQEIDDEIDDEWEREREELEDD